MIWDTRAETSSLDTEMKFRTPFGRPAYVIPVDTCPSVQQEHDYSCLRD